MKKRLFVVPAIFPVVLLVMGASSGGGRQNNASAPEGYNYGEALQKAVYFYDCQEAGKLPAKRRVEWRGDSTLRDGADAGVDLGGGWYDAGDHIKYNLPMAFAATTLSWSAVEYREARGKSGQFPHLLANLRHVNDYFLKCFTNDTPGKYELYGQVCNSGIDHRRFDSVKIFPGGLDGKNGYKPFYRREAVLRLESAGDWNPANDMSFTALPEPGKPAQKTEHIPVYSGKIKVFGNVPA